MQRLEEPEDDKEEEVVQTQPVTHQIPPVVQKQTELKKDDEEELVQPKRYSGSGLDLSPTARSSIQALRGGGQPLSASSRTFFEPRFGEDFKGVRVHAGNRAADVSKSINAKAFTLGQDMVFGAGQYAPESSEGKKLMAHELTHVIQSRRCSNKIRRRVRNNLVNCRGASPAIVGANPVGTIRAADRRAVEMLDDIIGELQGSRRQIRRGQPIDSGTLSPSIGEQLRIQFNLNPEVRTIWTSRNARSVYTLIRRLQLTRRKLNRGWLRYVCLGPASITTAVCPGYGGSCCDVGTWACTCPTRSRIYLCQRWWNGANTNLDQQALTLIHETIHIYFHFIRDTGVWSNAHRYEQFVANCRLNLP